MWLPGIENHSYNALWVCGWPLWVCRMLRCGPMNPWDFIFHPWEKAQMWSKGGELFWGASPGSGHLGRAWWSHRGVGRPPYGGSTCSFSSNYHSLHKHTSRYKWNSLLIKYVSWHVSLPFKPRLLMVFWVCNFVPFSPSTRSPKLNLCSSRANN